MVGRKLYPVTATVEGAGEFPIDMLRYDACWPASERDSAILLDSMNGSGRRKVQLYHYTESAPARLDPRDPEYMGARVGLTPARWRSFSWRIVSVELGA
jgi:hypothetical protein